MLHQKKIVFETQIGIWKIEESEEQLLSMLSMDESIEPILSIRSLSRRVEMLSVRVLIKELLNEQKKISYYSSGHPYLADKSHYISISHTKGYVAVAVNKSHKVGIDIEYISEKVKRVQSRFISDQETIDPNQEINHLLIHWCVKESLFKILRESEVDFLNHLYIKPFTPMKEGKLVAQERKTSSKQNFDDVYYKIEEDFVLACITA